MIFRKTCLKHQTTMGWEVISMKPTLATLRMQATTHTHRGSYFSVKFKESFIIFKICLST